MPAPPEHPSHGGSSGGGRIRVRTGVQRADTGVQVQQRRAGSADGGGEEAALGGETGGLEAPGDCGGLLRHEAQRPPHVDLPAAP
jgi:hypothetical protein